MYSSRSIGNWWKSLLNKYRTMTNQWKPPRFTSPTTLHPVHRGALQKEASKLERQYELERHRLSWSAILCFHQSAWEAVIANISKSGVSFGTFRWCTPKAWKNTQNPGSMLLYLGSRVSNCIVALEKEGEDDRDGFLMFVVFSEEEPYSCSSRTLFDHLW